MAAPIFQEVSEIASRVTDPATIAAVAMGIAAFVTIVTIAAPFLSTDRLAVRMKSVSSDRDELRRRSRAAIAKDNASGGLRMKDKGPWKNVVAKLNLKTLLEDPNVTQKLMEAGMRGPTAVSMFYFMRFSLPFIFFGLAIIYLMVFKADMAANHKLIIAVGACALGFYAPNIYVSNVGANRRKSVMRAFPDALDLLLICVESGMAIEAAFMRVSEEIGTSSIELAEELALTNAELAYLQDRKVAYENLGKRTNHPGVKAVTIALVQAERYGTPLGSALRVMAKENRELRMLEAEKKAAALPAKLTVPMILFFLPVLFIVILTPAYIKFQQMKH